MLSPDERQEFHGALLNAFPRYESLEMMVYYELEQNLGTIVKSAELDYVVFKLIQWAETYGRLEGLIRGAYKYNSGNPLLKAFYQKKFLQEQIHPFTTQSNPEPSRANASKLLLTKIRFNISTKE